MQAWLIVKSTSSAYPTCASSSSTDSNTTMTTLTLYYAPGTCAQAVRIALEEANAPYTPVRLDFANAQQRTPEYLAVNPKGRVPALVTEHGTLTETPALLPT